MSDQANTPIETASEERALQSCKGGKTCACGPACNCGDACACANGQPC